MEYGFALQFTFGISELCNKLNLPTWEETMNVRVMSDFNAQGFSEHCISAKKTLKVRSGYFPHI